jgi:hypothetical protein
MNLPDMSHIILATTLSADVPLMSQITVLLVYFHDAIFYDHLFIIEGNTLKTLPVFVMSLMTEAMVA